MQHQGSATAPDGIVVASGWGLKVFVQHGQLIVHDGIGDQRETRRFNRATAGLKRLVVIGRSGFVTLEALRWIKDIDAALVQIGPDGEVVAMTAAERFNNTKPRRAQVLAAETDVGVEATRELLVPKLERQIDIAARLAEHLVDEPRFGHAPHDPVPVVISRQLKAVKAATTLEELRAHESVAGRWYWHALAHVPVRFHPSWAKKVSEHWHYGGPRTSALSGLKSSRKAATPLHALVNYAYAILETEATIVLQAFGFDPSLGILHSDKRYRGSLAADLMEAGRPAADEVVLRILEERELRRGDVYETREGACRLGTALARELAGHSLTLRDILVPHASRLANASGRPGGSAAGASAQRSSGGERREALGRTAGINRSGI